MSKASVLLADDHRMFLAGLQKLLEADFEIVGTVVDGRALLAAAAQLRPDVIVADVSMPLLNGIEAARQLAMTIPETKIVFLSMHADALFAAEALKAGAAAYVLKRDAPGELVAAIRKALRGKETPVRLRAPEADWLSEADSITRRSPASLTSRQREVLQLAAEGKSLKEIASILNISVKTVEFHKYRLMRLLGVRTNSELTAIAIRHGLISG